MRHKTLERMWYCTRGSLFGVIAVLWSEYKGRPKIYRILIPKPGKPSGVQLKHLFSHSQRGSCSEIDEVANGIESFLAGDAVKFFMRILRMDLCTKFQRKVLRAEFRIPRGRVSSYQRIGKHVGSPKGARAVGNVLATNRFPLIIPCHRALASDGSLGGYQGGLKMKRALLEMEGVEFDGYGKVSVEDFYY
jgi:methylated-DNA-[protein]-cysteine S-methyltransferase